MKGRLDELKREKGVREENLLACMHDKKIEDRED